MAFSGHFWTVSSRLRKQEVPPEASAWSLEIRDTKWDSIRLSGLLREEPGAEALVLVIHGIAGCAEASYAQRAAAAASSAGFSCLRLNLRGCDRRGEDIYHAGLTSDLAAVMETPEVSAYRRVHLVGYSLGGHLALHYGCHAPSPQLASVMAVCSPLGLSASTDWIDHPRNWAYRRFLLRYLREIYQPVVQRRALPVSMEEAERIDSVREWDDRITSRRWGFKGAEDYYQHVTVGPSLNRLAVPGLFLAANHDPVVPKAAQLPHLDRASSSLEVRWVERGGHVSFPPRLDLGFSAELGLEGQIFGWLAAKDRLLAQQ